MQKEFKWIPRVCYMDVYDTVYAILDANGNSIRGRTVIQKLVYLANEKISTLDVPPYTPHYYGPFSPGLGWALEKMVSYYFLHETSTPGAMHEGYKYDLTSDGKTIAKASKKKNNGTFEKIARIVNVCRDFCELKSAPLSYASKIHYLLSHESYNGMSFQEAKEYAEDLGWEVSKDNVEQGAKLLEKLDLARVS